MHLVSWSYFWGTLVPCYVRNCGTPIADWQFAYDNRGVWIFEQSDREIFVGSMWKR